MVALGLGRVPSPVEVHVDARNELPTVRTSLPSSYDLRKQGRLTPVKDQGSWATCWAFANTAALESTLMPEDPSPDFSEDNLVGHSGYGPVFPGDSDAYDFGGYDFMAVAYFARWAGPVNETDDPYDRVAQSAPSVQAHVQKVVMIPGRASWSDNALVKRLVRRNGALSVGMKWDWSAYHRFRDRLGHVHAAFYLPGEFGENHGVAIVGWNDNYPRRYFRGNYGAPPGRGAFLVRNTWGTSFGENGYFWVSYYDRSFACEQGLGGYGGMTSYATVEAADNYSAIYQYDELGVTDHWGYGAASIWGASRFTATADQTISAAGFYALSSATSYQVWTGPDLKSMTLRATGTKSLPGYTTVALTSPLSVTAGQEFVVAVRLVSPRQGYPLAIERRARKWMQGAVAERGETYVSRDGVRWTDATEVYPTSSVCLKAFAD
jgi:C1A family cysteine protease